MHAFKARKCEGCAGCVTGGSQGPIGSPDKGMASLEDLQDLSTGLEAQEVRGLEDVGEVRGCGPGPQTEARARVSLPGEVRGDEHR